jgi:hypothetical protein
MVAVASSGREFAFWRTVQNTDSIGLGRFGDSTVVVLTEGTTPRLMDDRHLVYRSGDGVLSVMPIDLATLRATGPRRPLVEGIGESGGRQALFAVARDGSLVYATGASAGLAQLVWVDRSGTETHVGPAEPAIYASVALSQDDRRVAVTKGALFVGASDVWVIDLAQGSSIPITSDGQGARPTWIPDGKTLVFPYGPTASAGRETAVRRPADGSTSMDTLLVQPQRRPVGEVVISPDGVHMAYRLTRAFEQTPTRDILYRRVDGADSARPFAAERFQERGPRFSPDGNWLVYVSDRTGRDEIYAERFPDGGQRVSISTEGGREPVWSRDGSEIFYRTLDGLMMSARLTRSTGAMDVARRDRLFDARGYLSNQFLTMYDVARDGRFLMIKLAQQAARTDLVLVRNWRAEVDSLRRDD